MSQRSYVIWMNRSNSNFKPWCALHGNLYSPTNIYMDGINGGGENGGTSYYQVHGVSGLEEKRWKSYSRAGGKGIICSSLNTYGKNGEKHLDEIPT